MSKGSVVIMLSSGSTDWEITGLGVFTPEEDITAWESSVILSGLMVMVGATAMRSPSLDVENYCRKIADNPQLRRHFKLKE